VNAYTAERCGIGTLAVTMSDRENVMNEGSLTITFTMDRTQKKPSTPSPASAAGGREKSTVILTH
jgi:hypothetical protein